MTELTHVVRLSMFGKELTFMTSADALIYSDGDQKQIIPYSNITSIQVLSYENFSQGKTLKTQNQAVIRTRSQGALKMRSHHFESLGSFEDRSQSYAAILSELLGQVAAHNPSAKFVCGSKPLFYVWIALFVLSIALTILLTMAVLGGAENILSLSAGIMMSIAMAAFSWRSIKQNRLRTFEVSDAPLKLP